MKNKKISPLWRKENKTSLQSCSVMDSGSDYKYTRNTKHEKDSNKFRGKMSTKSYSRDWTPLFKYLLKSIGKDWNDVYLEIKDRILPLPNKKKNPIDLMVIKDAYIGNDNNLYSISEQCPMFNSTGFVSSVFRCGEATYYSKLYKCLTRIIKFTTFTIIR